MADALLNGRAASFDRAVDEAARLLAGARLPLVAGLAADVAAIRAALKLARRLKAAVDHAEGATLAKIASLLASSGTMIATPQEVRTRADLIVLAGPVPEAAQSVVDYVLAGNAKRIVAVGVPAAALKRLKAASSSLVAVPAEDGPALAAAIAALRATLSGKMPAPSKPLAEAGAALGGATFGAAVYDPAALDEPSSAMLLALVNDLNQKNRFTSLPLPVGVNGSGALMAAGWLADAPLPYGHRSDGETVHDPYLYAAPRLVASRECDAVLWLDTLGHGAPAWLKRVPSIAVASAPTGAAVHLDAGVPGHDHDGVLYRGDVATLAYVPASAATGRRTAHAIIEAIAQALPKRSNREASR